MRRRHRLLLGSGLLVGLVLALVGGNVLAHYLGWGVARMTPAALSAKLAPFYRVARPEGAGPFPAALLYSGCDGPKDNMTRWSEALVAHGWAAVVVDSHAPRGLGEHERWRLVCAGQLFMGSERAGDVLVSLDDVRRMPFVDPGRIVLLGASHGGWAIMDLLALDPPAALPFNLTSAPGQGDPLAGLVGTVLLYPYCGEANRANPNGWPRPVPTLFVLAGADTIVDADACREVAEALRARGTPVEILTLPGIDHGFDQAEKAPLSTLRFDPAATDKTIATVLAFLDRLTHGE